MKFTDYLKKFDIYAVLFAFALAAIGALLEVENMFPAMIALALYAKNRIDALNERDARKKEQERTQKHQERIEKLLEGISAQK